MFSNVKLLAVSKPIFTEVGPELSAQLLAPREPGDCDSNCGVVIPTFLGIFLGLILLGLLIIFLVAYRRRTRGKTFTVCDVW